MGETTNPNVALFYVKDTYGNSELFRPYMLNANVNGRIYIVFRDSTSTMDVEHCLLLDARYYNEDSVFIKQAVDAQKVCVPMAKVKLEDTSRQLAMETKVSPNLLVQYTYLF